MTRITCDALRSDDTLGLLAALGIVQLCSSSLGGEVRLSWTDVGGPARLEVPFEDVKALAGHLSGLARQMDESGQVLPCADPGPVGPASSPAERRARRQEGRPAPLDPAKLSPEEGVVAYGQMRRAEVDRGDLESARWLSALVNQLSVARSTGLCALTPLYSPSGQMTLYQLYRDHLKEVVQSPGLLDEALVRWRRRPGTGANLDTRALRDAVAGSSGQADNAAVVGASWLALMSVPFFRQVGNGRSAPEAVGWQSEHGGPRLRWPVWTQPLDRAAIEVLLGHPSVAGLDMEGLQRARPRTTNALRGLGVVAVCTSSRRPLSNSAGALQPPVVVPVR